MKIDQVSSSLNFKSANVLAKILEVNPLLQYAEFRLEPSNFGNIPDKSSFSGSAARAEGSLAQADAQIPNPSYGKLAIYDREITVDNLRVQDINVSGSPLGLQRFMDRQVSAVAVKLGSEVQIDMIQGTATDNRMLGLANFVKDAASGGQTATLGFTAAEQAAMNTQVSLQLNTTANQDSFIETLMKQVAAVPGANAIICNINLAARLTTIAKRLGAAGETVNSFGMRANTFNGIPIIAVDTNTITQTESDGTNNDCTSIFVVRFAEELGVAFVTNTGFYYQDFPQEQAKPGAKARVGFYLNLSVERTDAVRRLSRIRL
jgi:hypothetical protein